MNLKNITKQCVVFVLALLAVSISIQGNEIRLPVAPEVSYVSSGHTEVNGSEYFLRMIITKLKSPNSGDLVILEWFTPGDENNPRKLVGTTVVKEVSETWRVIEQPHFGHGERGIFIRLGVQNIKTLAKLSHFIYPHEPGNYRFQDRLDPADQPMKNQLKRPWWKFW